MDTASGSKHYRGVIATPRPTSHGDAEALDPTQLAALIVQRKCKDFSRYRFLVYEKRDLRYAPFESRARDSVLEALPALPAELRELDAVLRRAFEELRA